MSFPPGNLGLQKQSLNISQTSIKLAVLWNKHHSGRNSVFWIHLYTTPALTFKSTSFVIQLKNNSMETFWIKQACSTSCGNQLTGSHSVSAFCKCRTGKWIMLCVPWAQQSFEMCELLLALQKVRISSVSFRFQGKWKLASSVFPSPHLMMWSPVEQFPGETSLARPLPRSHLRIPFYLPNMSWEKKSI